MSKTDVLTAEEFGQLASAASATARSHLQAADHLLEGGFWPQARALAVLAFEEAGKSWLCVTAMLSPNDMREQLPFGELSWHVPKLTSARSVLALLITIRGDDGAPLTAPDALAEMTELARDDNAGKFRSLYTDWREGKVWSPSDVTEAEARATVAEVRDVLDHAGSIVDLAVALWQATAVPAPVAEFLTLASEALQGDDGTRLAFIEAELAKIDDLAGVLAGPADWLREALARELQNRQTDS